MSFIANTAFKLRSPIPGKGATDNITGKFLDKNNSNAAADCSAGFLVTKLQLLDIEGYPGVKSGNNWSMVEAEATDIAEGIYAADPGQVAMLASAQTGAQYKIGGNTLGLGIPAGNLDTFKRIVFDGNHVYQFGVGNMAADVGSNTYFTIANGLLVPAADVAALATGKPYFKLVRTGTFTEGPGAAFAYYDVSAHTKVTVA